jgi:hypothetical protein
VVSGQAGAPQPWWQAYDTSKIQLRDRYLFADVPLPAGLATTKSVDWSALDAQAGAKKRARRPPRSPREEAREEEAGEEEAGEEEGR